MARSRLGADKFDDRAAAPSVRARCPSNGKRHPVSCAVECVPNPKDVGVVWEAQPRLVGRRRREVDARRGSQGRHRARERQRDVARPPQIRGVGLEGLPEGA